MRLRCLSSGPVWRAGHRRTPTTGHGSRAICSGLEGVALAIELAAARLATFGIDGLEAGLADQLGLLAGGPRLDTRHRSVRSALDWSLGLLTEEDRVVLRRASVFAAPFTVGAVASVAGFRPLATRTCLGPWPASSTTAC